MSTVIDHTSGDQANAKTHAIISYVWLGLGLFTGIPILIAAIWAAIKRGSAKGMVYHSHYTNVIRVFWWCLLWTIIGWITVFILIGWVILAAAWIWALYRLINGAAKVLSDQAYPV